MSKVKLNLKEVIAIAICLAGFSVNTVLAQTYAIRWDWSKTDNVYEVLEINPNNGNVTLLGSSSVGVMDIYYDLENIFFDETSNQIVSLQARKNIWKFDLTTKTDDLISINTADDIRALTVYKGKYYGIRWNDANNTYEVLEVNPNNGNVTSLGSSFVMDSYYDLENIFFDKTSNQIVSLHAYKNIWRFDLSTKTGTLINIDTEDDIRALTIVNKNNPSNLYNPLNTNVADEVIGYFDILGRKLKEEPKKGIYIILYDNGKTEKVMK